MSSQSTQIRYFLLHCQRPKWKTWPRAAAHQKASLLFHDHNSHTLTCVSSALSSALDTRSGVKVAIKKLYRPFQSELFAKRAYRELRLLKHMKHENVRHITWAKFKGPAAQSPLWLVPAGVICVPAPQVIGLLDVFTADLSLDAFHDL